MSHIFAFVVPFQSTVTEIDIYVCETDSRVQMIENIKVAGYTLC